MKYTYVCRTTLSGLPWTYETDFATQSHQMAIEYGKRVAANLASTPWFMALDLFCISEDNQVHLGTFTVKLEPVVKWESTL